MTSQNKIATFNLRETGPLKPADIDKRMAGGFRVGKQPTIDPKPCPHCGHKVEWAPTSAKEGKEVVRYIYARCTASPQEHNWGFRAHVQPSPPVNVNVPIKPSGDVMTAWID